MLKKILLCFVLVGAAACGSDTDENKQNDDDLTVKECKEGEECSEGKTCEGGECTEEENPLACDEGQTCPIGSECDGKLCESAPSSSGAPLACDDQSTCSDGYDCVESRCQYSAAGQACTTETATANCGDSGFCLFTMEQNCGAENKEGVCSDGFIDALSAEEDVVCGCDGNSYWNPDEALLKQVSVASEGLCGDPKEETAEL